jgi:hypothetical protein
MGPDRPARRMPPAAGHSGLPCRHGPGSLRRASSCSYGPSPRPAPFAYPAATLPYCLTRRRIPPGRAMARKKVYVSSTFLRARLFGLHAKLKALRASPRTLRAKLSARRASRGTSPAKPRCSGAGVPGSVREPTVDHRPPFSSLSRTLGQHSRMNTMGAWGTGGHWIPVFRCAPYGLRMLVAAAGTTTP